MTHQHRLRLAITCLQELQQSTPCPLTADEISRRKHLSVRECEWAIDRLAAAGLVDLNDFGAAVLAQPDTELTSLEVLQAVWGTQSPAASAEWLYGPSSVIPTGWLASDSSGKFNWEGN